MVCFIATFPNQLNFVAAEGYDGPAGYFAPVEDGEVAVGKNVFVADLLFVRLGSSSAGEKLTPARVGRLFWWQGRQ